jgi:transcriptional regulator with XRE-family HTH domain
MAMYRLSIEYCLVIAKFKDILNMNTIEPNLSTGAAAMPNPINRPYFDALLLSKGLSLRRMATMMGKTHSQLSLTLSGARNMPLEEAAFWSEHFGEPLFRIAQNAGIEVRPITNRRAEIAGHMNGAGQVEMDLAHHRARVIAPDDMPEGCIAIQARTVGTGMEYMDGWLFFCAAPTTVEPDIIGRMCFVQIKGGPTVLAGLRRGYLPDTHNLYGFYEQENATLEWATPILKIHT